MKFSDSLYKYSLISGVSSLAAAQDVDSSTSAPLSVAKVGFNKLYGKSMQEAVARHKEVSKASKKAAAGGKDYDVDLKNQDTYYSVNISIGDPGQEMTVQLDTGSSDLWVISPGGLHCPNNNMQKRDGLFGDIGDPLAQLESALDGGSDGGYSTLFDPNPDSFGFPTGSASGSAPAPSATPTGGGDSPSDNDDVSCQTSPYFNADKSKTFQKNNTDPYRTKYQDYTYANGYWGTDIIQIGDLRVTNASFGVADDTNSTTPVFGIGFPNDESSYTPTSDEYQLQNPHTYPNFPQLLKEQDKIQAVAYSLYLNSPKSSDGNVLFGGVDHSKYTGQLNTLPVLKLTDLTGVNGYSTLAVTLQGVELTTSGSTNSVGSDKYAAVLDSGTTAVYLPSDIADSISSQYGGSLTEEGYVIECPQDANDDKITYDFGGFKIQTDLSDYIVGQESGQCLLGIVPQSEPAVLGDFFLRNAYVVYDLDRREISMAQASFSSSQEQIEAITSNGVPGAQKASGYSNTWQESQF